MSEFKRYGVQRGNLTENSENSFYISVVRATDFDAQRLRADTAEAENKLLRHQLAASAQELRKVSSWICREVEAGTTSATHWAIRLNANADQIDAALNPKPEAGSHE